MNTFGNRLKKIRKEKSLRQKDLAKVLGLAQTTIANYEQNMRFPNQKNLNRIANYFNVSLDYLIGTKKHKNNLIYIDNKDMLLSQLSSDYLKVLLNGDKDKAKKIIEEAISKGITIQDIYLHVLEPALKELGTLWSYNDVNISQEHFCSFITQQIMAQIITKNSYSKEHKAVVVTVSGELHEIGVKMVAYFLEMDGWNVYYLGTNTPTQSIIDAIKFTGADILVVSATIPFYVDAVENLIKVIRASKECGAVKILVGGQAFNDDLNLWKRIGSDGYSLDAKEAVKVANRLVIDK